ncbi:conserved Plasmodium protein, unknown function [Plasmodium knowlesi strain H]|uniref:Uncharacterized protein n=3 Tax=Plasmodium knowlesi TaxID=5850 RepID=A0A1A7VR29_PLAKH|nr:conserved Plasmodium protein, unknown function [Plasmodium knowlesi strain H]OTN66165.1 Uncharacterized protein PKNOH_S09535000 [Plasmodium knowlesi]CAA9989957.1 conserved Plasmodium protein, unknown function [Plasmodium knowlesi strain H]SBO24538.1 conserved Plasmodium protein, unknown function [Plasmodium knowlesi strain H]SBO26387.1 conserved Plasmodium protein, unknown function [Plasmodium knowlesi strain H]VVS79431.1 conserved Plasmodium protein, unknown function [Plasmodium knowlesi s
MIHSFSLGKMNSLKNQMVPTMLEMQTGQVTPLNATSNKAQLRVEEADFNNIYLDILNIHDSIVNHLQTIIIDVYNMVEKSLLSSSGKISCRELHKGGNGPHGSDSAESCINFTNDEQNESTGGCVVSSSNGAMRSEGKQPRTHVDINLHVKMEPPEDDNCCPSEDTNVGNGSIPNNEMSILADISEKSMMDRTHLGRTKQSVNTFMLGEYQEREESIPSIKNAKEMECANNLAKVASNYDAPVELIINKIEPKTNKYETFHGESPHKGNNSNVEEVIKENKLNLRKHIILMELLKYVMVNANNSQTDLCRDKIVNPEMGSNNDMDKLKRNLDYFKMKLNSDESICYDQNLCNVKLSNINIKYLNIISYYMDLLSPFNKFHGEKRGGYNEWGQRCANVGMDVSADVGAHAQLTLVRKKLDDIALNYDDLVEEILKNNGNSSTESYLYALKDRILQGEFPHEGATDMHGEDSERQSRILLSDLKRQPRDIGAHDMSPLKGYVHTGRCVGGGSIGSGTFLGGHAPYNYFSHAAESFSECPNEDSLPSVNPFPGGNAQEGEVRNWGPPSESMINVGSVSHRPGRNNSFGKKAFHNNSSVPKGYTFKDGGGAIYKGRKRSIDESPNIYDNMMCEGASSYSHIYNNNDRVNTFNQITSTQINYAHAIGRFPSAGIKHWVKQTSKEHTENLKKPICDGIGMNYDPYFSPTMYKQESNFIPQDKYNKNGNDNYWQYYKGGYYAGREEGFNSYEGNFKNGIRMEDKKEHFSEGSEMITCTDQNYSNDTNSADVWGYHHVDTLNAQGRVHYDANGPRILSPRRITQHEEQNQDGGFTPPHQGNIKDGTKLKFLDEVGGGKHLGEVKSGEKEGENSHNWGNSHNIHAQSVNGEGYRDHGRDFRRDTEKTHCRIRNNKYDSSYCTNDKHILSATPIFKDGVNWKYFQSPNDDGAYTDDSNVKNCNDYSGGGALKREKIDGQSYVRNKEGEEIDNAFLNREKDSWMRKIRTSSFIDQKHENGEDILGTQFGRYLLRSKSLNSYNRPSSFSFYTNRVRDGFPRWYAQNDNSHTSGGTNYTSGKNRQRNDESNGGHNNDTDGRGSNNRGGYSHSGGSGNNGISRSNNRDTNDNDGDDDKNGEHGYRGKKDYYDEKEDEEDENENDRRGKNHCAGHTSQYTFQDDQQEGTNNQFNMNPNDVSECSQYNGVNKNNSENVFDDPSVPSRRKEGVESFLEDQQLMESNMSEPKYERHGNNSGAPNRVDVSHRMGVASGASNLERARIPSNRSNRVIQPSQPNQADQPNLPDSATLGGPCNFIPFGDQTNFPDPGNYGDYGGFENFGNYGGCSNFDDRSYGTYSNCANFCGSYSNDREREVFPSNSRGVQPRRGDRGVARSVLTHNVVEPVDELRVQTGAGCGMGTNNQVQFHNEGNSPMCNEMYTPQTDTQNNIRERNRSSCKPSIVKMGEKNESMEHDLINFTNNAYVDIHKIIRNDDLLKNELSGLEESLQLSNAETKGSKKNTGKYNSNELEILMMYDSCKSMLKSCNMLRSEELKNTDGDEYLINETCIPPNVLTNSDMMSDSLNADIEKIIDIMSTNMQAKSKDKKRKLSSINCPPNDRTLPNGEKNLEYMGDKSNAKKMPRSSEDKRKKYQKMDIRTLNKNVQKNKEVCKNCYIHYDNSKSSYILTFINRKQKKQRKLFPVNPNEKDEAYVIQIMNYIEKLKDQEKIFGISKNDEMGALQRGEASNLHRNEGGKLDTERRNYDKDQQMHEKQMAKESYTEANLPKKNEMCSTNLNLLNKKMNNFLSGINDHLYMDPQMNFIPEHLPFVQNVGGNPNVNHVNIYEDVNSSPSGVDYINYNLPNDGHSFENLHLMNPCTSSVQNINPFFKLHSKKGDFSTRMNDQYVGDVVGGKVNTGGESVHGGVVTDINKNNATSCRNASSGMNSLEGRPRNRRTCHISGSSHNRGSPSGNSPFPPNVYENAMMHPAMKNVMYQGENNQTMNHQKRRSSGNPTNANDQFSPMNIFTNPNFSNYNQTNIPNSCENEMMHNYNPVINDYGDSMLVESNYDSDRVTTGGRTVQHNE